MRRRVNVDEFQSAPRPRGRGDTNKQSAGTNLSLFQSAPRPRGRGDFTGMMKQDAIDRFQSAPRPRGRGDNSDPIMLRIVDQVSIRAPPTRAGRLNVVRTIRPSPSRFNPRPAHAGGATRHRSIGCWNYSVSIRAPPTRAGRHRTAWSIE